MYVMLRSTGTVHTKHRRRIYTEDKAKVVAAVWGTEFIQFLAALAVLHQDGMKDGREDGLVDDGR